MVMNDFFEKTLEDMIYEKRHLMKDKGLDIFYKNCTRQFQADGKKFDIFTWEVVDNVISCRIIELKRDKLNANNVLQLFEYHSILLAALSGCFKKMNIELILIGTEVSSDIKNICYVSNIFRTFQYSYNFDGIKFIECGKKNDAIYKMVSSFEKDDDYKSIHELLLNQEYITD